jgi:hypothetical protein
VAKRTVLDHPKFINLKAALFQPKGATLGWLESVWHFCAKFTPQGNIGKYPDTTIEDWVEWNGKPGALIDALVKTGWIDVSEEHRLVIHDWHDHADDSTKKNLKRGNLDFLSEKRKKRVRKMSGHVQDMSGVGETHVGQFPPALPSLALPSPALPEPSDVRSPPEPLERKREEIFADLPKALNVPKFREAWGLWERYRVDSGHGCVQPMSRIQNWHDLEKFGAVKAESLVRNAIAKGWKQIHYDAKVPDIKPPPDPHRIDPVLARLRAEDAAAEKSAYQGGKTREALKREAG